jgi:hypothetical protein
MRHGRSMLNYVQSCYIACSIYQVARVSTRISLFFKAATVHPAHEFIMPCLISAGGSCCDFSDPRQCPLRQWLDPSHVLAASAKNHRNGVFSYRKPVTSSTDSAKPKETSPRSSSPVGSTLSLSVSLSLSLPSPSLSNPFLTSVLADVEGKGQIKPQGVQGLHMCR